MSGLSLSLISQLVTCAAARYPCPPWLGLGHRPGPSSAAVPRVTPSTPPPPHHSLDHRTGPPFPPPSLSPTRHHVFAARARRAISLGRSHRPRYSGSTPSPSFIAVEPVSAIRAPPRCRASEEPLPCSLCHPPLLACRSRRSATATSSSSVSHSSERASPPWLSSRARDDPSNRARAPRPRWPTTHSVVPKPLAAAPSLSPL
jgi:hypothetical protein